MSKRQPSVHVRTASLAHMRAAVAAMHHPRPSIREDAFVDVLAHLMQDCAMVFPCLAGS
jgi:hypothetical protein